MVLPTSEPSVLVGLPFIAIVLVLPSKRLSLLLVAGFAALVILGTGPRAGLWYLDRGWALLVGGWFVAVTLRWPAASFSSRALGSVAGAAAVVAVWMSVRPGSWEVFDWLVSDRIRLGGAAAAEAWAMIRGPALSQTVAAGFYQMADLQARLFPALTGLGSIAGLGVGWWLYVRLGHDDDRGLGPLREFRFNDQLVWVLIGGMILLLIGAGDGLARAGFNTVVFMGALYALRGVAVVLFFNGGLSFLGAVVLTLVLVLLWPIMLGAALLVGLGDTWLDPREKARALLNGGIE